MMFHHFFVGSAFFYTNLNLQKVSIEYPIFLVVYIYVYIYVDMFFYTLSYLVRIFLYLPNLFRLIN